MIKITADKTSLKVNDKTLDDFATLFKNFNTTFVKPGLLADDNNMTLQAALNCGDTIKDGTNQSIIQQLALFVTANGKVRFTLDQLKAFVAMVETNGVEKGLLKEKNFVRNKASVTSTITKMHITSSYDIAFDAATGIEQFFVPSATIRIFESIGKYLDPSSSRDSDIIFPQKGQTIVIDNEVFKRLGYDSEKGCFLQNFSLLEVLFPHH